MSVRFEVASQPNQRKMRNNWNILPTYISETYIGHAHIGCESKHCPSKQLMYIVHNWFHCATSLRISLTTLIHYCQIHYKWIIGHMCLASTYISIDHAQPWCEMGHDNRLKHIYSCLVSAIRHKLEHTNLAFDVI